MRLQTHQAGYTLWLSARETDNWANRPHARWPCSTTAGNRLMIQADTNGLCDLTVNGRDAGDVDGNELDAIVADFTRNTPAAKFWPNWS